jgi:diguanylate cyclase (GGDEF)-like protein
MRNAPLRRRTDPEGGDSAPLRALVVDDDQGYRSYLTELLGSFGFTVVAVGDGAEALAVLANESLFHLLLIDAEMPGVSGFGVISAIRTNDVYSDVYAIMVTARDTIETKVAALRLGFDDFLSKSATEVEIGAKINAARRLVARHKLLDDTVRELYGLATRDELTGLFNRRYFFAESERMLAEGTPISLVFFDLDEFKRVNDTLGHLAGDRILRDIGSLFLRHTRHEDFIARYGGDEFVMLVTSMPQPEVEHLAARMAADISSAQWTFGTETFSIGVTTGIAVSSLLEKPTVAQLLSAGDRDLYKNKWLRKHPEKDPDLYRYDERRDARILDMPIDEPGPKRMKDEG